MARNPFADRLKVMGIAPGLFAAARTQAENYLRRNDDQEEVLEADVRESISSPVSERVWQEIKKDLGFVLVLVLVLSGCRSTYVTRCFWTQEREVLTCITEESVRSESGHT